MANCSRPPCCRRGFSECLFPLAATRWSFATSRETGSCGSRLAACVQWSLWPLWNVASCLHLDFACHLPYDVGQLASSDSLGQFEQLVLTAILTLRDDAYGVTIHAKVEELARPKAASLGAVYVTLDRLEDKGFVSSW